MITFDLQCSNGHRFEGWFEDSEAFNSQNKKGMISCPYCKSSDITKLMSSFAIKRASSRDVDPEIIVDKLRHYVDENFDDVGTDFAREALKMHYGVVERRNIRGVSSPEEEKTMNSEGVKFLKIPLPSKTDDRDLGN